MLFQESLEPDNAFVLVPGVGILGTEKTVLLDVGSQVVASCTLFHVEVFLGGNFHHVPVFWIGFQRNGVQDAFRETAHALAGIPEHHGTGTHGIHNPANPLPCRQRLGAFLLQPGANLGILGHGLVKVVPAHLVVRVCRNLLEVVYQLVVGLLVGDKLLVVRKPSRVQHLETIELGFRIELQRSSRQKQQALGLFGNGVYQRVFSAGKAVFADQVVGLVYDGHVPINLEQVFDQGDLLDEKLHGNDKVVAPHKGVWLGLVLFHVHENALHVTVVHQGEQLVEAALHFYHPLVFQGIGNENQGLFDTATGLEGMPNHARLDGLAQAHLVRKHEPRECRAGAGPIAKVILVRNLIDTGPNHATHRRGLPLTA